MPHVYEAFRRFSAAALVCCLALGLAGTAMAQTDVTTGRISGVVRDGSDVALPGVSVELKNQDTGFTSTAITDSDGSYRLINLPTGKYTITATLAGMNTVSRPNVTVQLGSAPTINITMNLSSVSETITVTSRAPIVEVTNTSASTTIETEQLKSLPLNGRNFTDLALLTPETRRESERGNVAISGQRGINTNITIDGVDYNNAFFGGPTGVAEGRAPLSVSSESVKEFTVITNGASVEFGRSGGGFVNVITKSGTNDLHGSAFYYDQPQSLISDFRNGTKPADQHKTQWGASFGGPIMHDRLFYFGSYDRQDKAVTVPINPLVLDAEIFAKYPVLASGPTYAQTQNGWVGFGRLDFQVTNAQRFMIRANKAAYEGDNGTSSSANRTGGLTNGLERMDANTVVGSWSGQFGSNLLNDLTATSSREYTPRADKSPTLPEIQLGSYTYGGVSFLPIVSTGKRKGFSDTLTYLAGKHVVKAGAQYDDTSISQTFKGNWRGVFVFNSKADLIGGKWSQYRQFGGLGGLTADQAGTVAFGQKESALFFQDQWYVLPNVTVTAGLRWEKLDNPDDPVLNPNDRNANGSFKNNGTIPDVNNQLSPRLGASWSPDPKTVLRASVGRFWSRTPAILWSQLFASNGLKGTQLIIAAGANGPTDPLAPAWGANWNPVGVERIDFTKLTSIATPGVFIVDPEFTNPKTDRFTIGVDRELWSETAVGLEYTYAKSSNLERLLDANLRYDGTLAPNGLPRYASARPNTAYGRVTQYTSDAESKYYAITSTFKRRFAQNFLAFAAVTYSKDRDNDSNERNFSGIQAEDPGNLDSAWGLSTRDQRWKVAANAAWNTPWWGIITSGSFRYYTGSVFTPVLGSDANNEGNRNDRPTIGCANPASCQAGEGTHLDRNSFKAPQQNFLDFRIGKNFAIAGGKLGVFAECFNCANNANRSLGSVLSTWSTNNSNTPAAAFGKFNTYADPRTWQLAARFDF